MEPFLDFVEIAALINCSKTTAIDPSPEASGTGWALHRGTHRLHTATYPFHVFSLTSRATRESVALVGRKLRDMRPVDVVYPPSLEQRIPQLRAELRDAKTWTTKQYLASFIRDELGAYTAKLRAEAPKFYIDPVVSTPSGIDRRIPNPLRALLLDDSFKYHDLPGALGIVLAEPGQGKTYMCRYLVAEVVNSQKNLVPLMIDSSQWAAMPVADQGSLWKTISHSFRHFGAAIGWLEGNEDRFLRTTLKADLFRIVFDGFDEYVLRNQGEVKPLEVLDALSRLVSETGARIVITSRTSFWNANVSEGDTDRFVAAAGAHLFHILPFDQNHATNYFQKRLPASKVGEASRLWNAAKQRSAEIAGRGFVLSLVADLVERGESALEIGAGGSDLMWLVDSLCQRETLRQQLPYSGSQQVAALSTLASESARGVLLDDDIINLAFAETRPEIGIRGRDLLDKLKSHPLIQVKEGGSWEFREEQIRIALLAQRLLSLPSADLQRAIDQLNLDASVRKDLGQMLVDLRAGAAVPSSVEVALRGLLADMRDRAGSSKGVWTESQWLASTVLLEAVELQRDVREHKERAGILLRLLDANEVRGLAFFGTIARFDFRGITFAGCRFQQLTWANCQFDRNTVFNRCTFFGGAEPRYTVGFGEAQLIDCDVDEDAQAWIAKVQIKEGRRRYTSADLESDIRTVMSKFAVRGGLGLRTVEAQFLSRGPISASKFREDVLEELMRGVLEEHHVTGISGMGANIRSDAEESVRFYLTNNVMTGALKQAFDRLKVKLGLAD